MLCENVKNTRERAITIRKKFLKESPKYKLPFQIKQRVTGHTEKISFYS